MKYIAYHGTNSIIEKFTLDYVGKSRDRFVFDKYGGGLYFIANKNDAFHYGNIVYTVILNGRFLNSNTKLKYEHKIILETLITSSPDYEITLLNWGENINKALKLAVSTYIEKKTFFEAIQIIESDFWNGYTKEFCNKMKDLNIDGFRIDKGKGFDYFVVYNPQTIQIISKDKKIIKNN